MGSDGNRVIVYGSGLSFAGLPDTTSVANAAMIVKAVNAHERLVEALKDALETVDGIAKSNWRKWEELAQIEEFERWAISRTTYEANNIRAALAELEAQK